MRRSSLSVVPLGLSEPGLLEAVPSLDHCCQQSCTVDTFLPSLSAISRKENPPSRSPTTRPRTNSVAGIVIGQIRYTHQPYSDIVGLSRTASSPPPTLLYLSDLEEGVQKDETGVLEHFKLKNFVLNDECETYLKYQHTTY
ncbi:hypothetical protein AVEN_95725-1 [Araneus ventricosus]|uniref:Uncharacterized protein n=1 Tax=Araneus ventricosus TaxID=182803 RepID=A0A4Y2KF62_ARAVE|nr:hypothetical protein AVEN_140295-1 [Araneus ventricosus]GBN07323.1 hypothetical protein AVEN_95725-1 [Araneus ventricosus]